MKKLLAAAAIATLSVAGLATAASAESVESTESTVATGVSVNVAPTDSWSWTQSTAVGTSSPLGGGTAIVVDPDIVGSTLVDPTVDVDAQAKLDAWLTTPWTYHQAIGSDAYRFYAFVVSPYDPFATVETDPFAWVAGQLLLGSAPQLW